jgi:hypothetical protein
MNPRPYVDFPVVAIDSSSVTGLRSVIVRAYRDGHIAFSDPVVQTEYEYDLAFAAMGGDEAKSVPIRIHKKWLDTPSWVFGVHLFGTKIALRLSADYIRHVLPIYHKTYPDDPRPGQFLKQLKDYYTSKRPRPLAMLFTARRDAYNLQHKVAKDPQANYAAQCIARALWQVLSNACHDQTVNQDIVDVAMSTAVAPANARFDLVSPADRAAFAVLHNAEKLWQVRRFIDVIGAHQAGERIPRLEATR